MNHFIITGTFFVFLALAGYSLGLVFARKSRAFTDRVRNFFFAGLGCDVTATCFMIMGSRNSPFTFHGFVGYSALGMMALGIFLLARLRGRKGSGARIPGALFIYMHAAYFWWLVAFIGGAVMGAKMHHG